MAVSYRCLSLCWQGSQDGIGRPFYVNLALLAQQIAIAQKIHAIL